MSSDECRMEEPRAKVAMDAKEGECGKHRYASKKEARTALNARTTGRRHYRHNRPAQLRAYYCPSCDYWHLTHKL